MQDWTSIDEERRPSPAPPPPPTAPASRDPRMAAVSLALLALLIAGGGVFFAARHASRARRHQEEAEELRRQLAGIRDAADARVEADLRPLRARVEALAAERDALKADLEKAARMAEAREADHERALEILRLSAAPPPPPETPPSPKPAEPPPSPTAAPPVEAPSPPKPPEPPPAPAAVPAAPRRPAPVLPAPLEARIRVELERLRGEAQDRKAATDALLELRRREPALREALRRLLEEEKDPRVQARLQYVLEAIELSPLWTQTIGRIPEAPRTAVADASRLVVGGASSGLAALEASSGKRLWTQSTPGLGIFPSVVAGPNLVSVLAPPGSATWAVLVTRLSDGAAETMPSKLARGQSRLESDGDAVAFATDRASLECRDGRTGRKRWDATTLASLQAFAVGRGRVFLLDPRRRLVCRSAEDGKERWASTAVEATSVLGAAGESVLLGGPSGTVLAFDVQAGGLRWTARTPSRAVVSLAASADGTAVLRSYDGLMAADLADGRVLWSHPAAAAGAVPPVVFGGFLTTASGADVIFLDPRSGREVARRTPVPDSTIVALAAYRDRLFVVTPDTALAFELR